MRPSSDATSAAAPPAGRALAGALAVPAALLLYALLLVPSWSASVRGLGGAAAAAVELASPARNPHIARLELPRGQRARSGASGAALLLGGIAAAFLAVYLAPPSWKKRAQVASAIGLAAAYLGPGAAAELSALYLWLYGAMHEHPRRLALLSAALALACAGWGGPARWDELKLLQALSIAFTLAACASGARGASAAGRLALPQCALLMAAALALSWRAGAPVRFPAGVLVFLWSFPRLLMYRAEQEDGTAPRGLPALDFLALFCCPGDLRSWSVPQGYAHLSQRWLRAPHAEIALRAARMLLGALACLLLGRWAVDGAARALSGLGLPATGSLAELFAWERRGPPVSAATVAASCALYLCDWTLSLAGLLHFRAGLWRAFGYDVDPHFDRPWRATNLVSLWSRYTVHYRAILMKVFYEPAFCALRASPVPLRLAGATLYALFAGSLLLHVQREILREGASASAVTGTLETWPYFLLLAAGIAATQVYLLSRRERARPWSGGPLSAAGDAACAGLTMLYFALIHLFTLPDGAGSAEEAWRLLARAFGVG